MNKISVCTSEYMCVVNFYFSFFFRLEENENALRVRYLIDYKAWPQHPTVCTHPEKNENEEKKQNGSPRLAYTWTENCTTTTDLTRLACSETDAAFVSSVSTGTQSQFD